MNPIRHLVRVLAFLTLSTLARAAEMPRVAVVPDSPDPSVAAFSDLLAVSLASASNQYTLVERAEITRLASEAEIQKLAADQRPAALAKIAKADGLILVGSDKVDPKQPKLTVRLASTNNGLVLRSLILGGKEDEYPKAAELAAGVLRFSCERLSHGGAEAPVIVSLLGIRPVFEIDRALETTLNLAVAQQLSAQTGIAVSERWKMNDLVFERSLSDEKPQAFATGTVLLDGSYTRKGEHLEFSLRLRKAEEEAGKTLTLQGPVNKPVEVARQIGKLVATESGGSGKVLAWDALKEGKEYSALGQWLFERKLYGPAAQACESAVALGFTGDATLWNRSCAYMEMTGLEDAGILDRTGVGELERLSETEFARRVNLAIRMTQCVLELVEAKWGAALRTRNFHERNLYLELQYQGNLLLLQAVCVRQQQLALATEARTLRGLTRELVRRGNQEFRNNFGENKPQRCYMFDTPEQCAADLRQLLHPSRLTYVHWCKSRSWRSEFWGTCGSDRLWRMVDWSSTDNRGGREAWRRFIDEMRTSKVLLNRVDACAFAFGEARTDQERLVELDKLHALLQSSGDELMTPDGQKSFDAVGGIFWRWSRLHAADPRFLVKMSGLFTRLLQSGEWLDPPTIRAASSCVWRYGGLVEEGKAVIPEALAVDMLSAVEAYIGRARKDKRWKSQYQHPNHGNPDEDLKKMTGRIIAACPKLRSQRAGPRPPVPGAVAIRGWKPSFPGAPPDVWMNGSFIVPWNDAFFVPSLEHGILEVDARSLSVRRLIKWPSASAKFVGGFTRNDDSFMVNLGNRLFVTPASGDGGTWREVEIPNFTGKEGLDWIIEALGPEFFVGSSMQDDARENPLLMAGKVRDGKLTWLVASNRRPAVGPLDSREPRNVAMAFRNPQGKTIMMLGHGQSGGSPIHELESGMEISSLHPFGFKQARGGMPLAWHFSDYDEEIRYLAAFDPATGKPRMIFCSDFAHWAPGLPEFWKGVKPVHDYRKKEFLGESITAIVHEGFLWILGLEPRIAGSDERYGSNDFRLLRIGLDGGETKVVPLRMETTPSMLTARMGDRVIGPMRAIINERSFTATPHGLVFALVASPTGADTSFTRALTADTGRYVSPLLFHIEWREIQAWLEKSASDAAKPASP